ncbi:DUF5677 domain-containing protein [Streptacidiphilus sp. N1-10]|uniref:DUF5677 domain-containing protein n=1 Tax=Streptacidiphilus jeojiensis TaxID=3229225 RepID=A0ABV6XQF2_9ACTN
MVYDELEDEHLPDPYGPNWDALGGAADESPFMEAAFYLLREGTQWFGILAGLVIPEKPFARNDAILRGLLVRQCKLLRLTLRELHSQETFQQQSITRDSIETLATLLYLLSDDGTGIHFDRYIMNSLVAERELLRDIEENIKLRNGEVWPIEERMKRSAEKTAKAAGIDDVSKLPGRAKIRYPNAEERIKLLGRNAYIAYRMGSVETHGDWNDLYRNHLSVEGGEFLPNLKSFEVRPQVPLMLVILSFTVVLDNIERLTLGNEAADFLRPYLEDLLGRTRKPDELHEQFMISA